MKGKSQVTYFILFLPFLHLLLRVGGKVTRLGRDVATVRSI